MNKFLVFVISLIIGFIVVANLSLQEEEKLKTPQEIYSMLKKASVIIKGNNMCSGVIVKSEFYPDPFILTASHCLSSVFNTACFSEPLTPLEIYPILIDDYRFQGGLDLAVFKFSTSEIAKSFESVALTLGSSNQLREGDTVYSIAVHHELPFGFGQGSIFSLRPTSDYLYRPQTILIQSVFGFGSSGGATVNSRGEVIGINNSIIFEMDHSRPGAATKIPPVVFGLVPIDDIKEDLKLLPTTQPDKFVVIKHPNPIKIYFINSWEYTNEELSFMGIKRPGQEGVIVGGGLFEHKFLDGVYLQLGDKIISCDNNIVKTKMDIYRSIFFCFKKSIIMKIERNGQIQEIELPLL